MFEGMESAFQSPVSPSADPDREATHRQVMSAQPTRVLEGEASGPDYRSAGIYCCPERRRTEKIPGSVAKWCAT